MFHIRQKQSKESIVLQKYAELIKNAENGLFLMVFNMSMYNAAEMLLQIRRKSTAFSAVSTNKMLVNAFCVVFSPYDAHASRKSRVYSRYSLPHAASREPPDNHKRGERSAPSPLSGSFLLV